MSFHCRIKCVFNDITRAFRREEKENEPLFEKKRRPETPDVPFMPIGIEREGMPTANQPVL